MARNKKLRDVWDIMKEVKNLKNAMKVNDSHFVKNTHVYYSFQPDEKMGGTVDGGDPRSLTGKEWLDEYMRMDNLTWDQLEVSESQEKFRFGSGPIHDTVKTVKLPVLVTDKRGVEVEMILDICVVDAKIPLLIGRDAHKYLNIKTDLRKSECFIGEDGDARRFKLLETKGGHWKLEFNQINQVMYSEPVEEEDEFFNTVSHVESEEDEFFDAESEFEDDDVMMVCTSEAIDKERYL